jgi:hypothetical protein
LIAASSTISSFGSRDCGRHCHIAGYISTRMAKPPVGGPVAFFHHKRPVCVITDIHPEVRDNIP